MSSLRLPAGSESPRFACEWLHVPGAAQSSHVTSAVDPLVPHRLLVRADRAVLCRAEVDGRTLQLDASLQARLNPRASGKLFALAEKGLSSGVVGGSARYEGDRFCAGASTSSDGGLLGGSINCGRGDGTSVGAEFLYSLEERDYMCALGARKQLVSPDSSSARQATLSASMTIFGRIRAAYSQNFDHGVSLVTTADYDLASYDTDYRVGLRMEREGVVGGAVVDIDRGATLSVASAIKSDLHVQLSLSKGWDPAAPSAHNAASVGIGINFGSFAGLPR